MQECVQGSTEIRTYFLWKPFEEKQERQLEEIGRKQLQIGKYRAFRRAVVVIVTDCVTIVSLLLLGGFLAGKGIIAFSDVMLALPLSDQIGQMLVAFGNYHTILRIHAPHMERVFEVLDLQQEEASEDGEAVNCAGGSSACGTYPFLIRNRRFWSMLQSVFHMEKRWLLWVGAEVENRRF